MSKSLYQTLSSKHLWKSKWYNLRQDAIRTPDGTEGTYTIVEHPGAVWVPDRWHHHRRGWKWQKGYWK